MSKSSITSSPRVIDDALLGRVLAQAAASPRRRANHNFHAVLDHPCQRLINALLADAYIQPHRHLDPAKEEMLVVLRGGLGLLFFDEHGRVIDKIVLAAGGKCLAANIPVGLYHTAVALTPECVVFEAKAGPYAPHRSEELAAFAPAEGDPSAPATLARWKAQFSVPST